MTNAAASAFGRRTPWRSTAVALLIALVGVSCSATGGETVISADTSPAPTEVPADKPVEDTPEPTVPEPTAQVPTAVPEPTVAVPTATATPTAESPVRLVAGETTRGTIADANEPVLFEFVAEAGDIINLAVEPLDQDLDVVVDVVDSAQQSIIGGELDDSFGAERIGPVAIEMSGVFTVVVSSFADKIGDVSVLVEFVDLSGGQLVDFGQVTVIEVTASDSVAQVNFVAEQGALIDVTVVPLDELDVVVDVRDVNGESLLANGPVDSSFDTERIRVLEMPADGIYAVVVSGYQGASGSAEVVVDLALKGFGTVLRGTDTIDDPQQPQEFSFNAVAGDLVRLVVDPDEVGHDVVLSVIEVATETVLDEVDANTGLEELVIEAPRDGDYYFQVSSFDDSVGSFAFILLAPDTTVLALDSDDVLRGRMGGATSMQYTFQPPTSGTLTIVANSPGGTELNLEVFDTAQEQVVDPEDTGDGGQTLSYEVTADIIYLIDMTSRLGDVSFELGITLE